MRKHPQWFPFIIFGITMLLAVTIVLVDRARNQPPDIVVVNDVLDVTYEEVDVDAYKSDMTDMLFPIWELVMSGEGSVDRVELVRDRILATKVPGEYRDIHIGAVVALNKLIDGLGGDDDALAEAQIRFTQLSDDALWLK